MSNQPISIIILSFNRKNEIIKTIEDLKSQTYGNFEIIVVDQASTDGATALLQDRFPEINLIRLYKNIGVGGGRNVGAMNAKGEILVFIDNDASLAHNALEMIAKRFTCPGNEKIGIIGFKIINTSTGELQMNAWGYSGNRIMNIDKDSYVHIFPGGGSAIRKEAFEQLGYYWDELFFTAEEADLSIRALAAGYDILYSPEILLYHRASDEKRTHKGLRDCLTLRNMLWILWRDMPRGYSIVESFVRIVQYFIRAIRRGYFFKMLVYFLGSFSKIGLLFNNRYRISGAALRRYKHLLYRGSTLEQMRYLFFDKT